MTGKMSGRKDPPEGWVYTPDGHQAMEEETKKFEDALYDVWRGKTRSRGSKSLDGPDCREASRYLLVGMPAPLWKLILRIAATVFLLFPASLIVEAFDGNRSASDVAKFLLSGLIIAAITVTLLETALKK